MNHVDRTVPSAGRGRLQVEYAKPGARCVVATLKLEVT